MTARNFSLLSAVIFTIIALVQLSRAIGGWEITLGGTAMPIWPSWVVAIVAGVLAWLGYGAART